MIGPVTNEVYSINEDDDGLAFRYLYAEYLLPEFMIYFEKPQSSGYIAVIEPMVARQVNRRFYLDWAD